LVGKNRIRGIRSKRIQGFGTGVGGIEIRILSYGDVDLRKKESSTGCKEM
jgi:hypothetical protein